MIYILLILAGIVLILLEYFWANHSIDALHTETDTDIILAEPGEKITWTITVHNRSRLPIPFVRLMISFPFEATLHSERSHSLRRTDVGYVEEKFSIRPRRSVTRQVNFSISKRGNYSYAKFQISSGDLLGFKETYKDGAPENVVIMPEHSRHRPSIDALGGFLGEISVRRFILEDPILTMGFRDYTGREPMKHISWTRSATASTLQVKQFDYTAERHVVVILNTEGAGREELEECLSLTRTVCEKLEQHKIPYGFRTNGNIPGPVGKIFHMAEGLGTQHLRTILYGLGRADRTCFYSFRYLAERTLQHRSSNESYIIITPPQDGAARAAIQKLENAVGNSLCILTAVAEKDEVR